MGSPYPYELRIRAIAALEAEKSISKIARLFKISRDTLHKWKNIKKTTGDIIAKKGYQKGHSPNIA